MNDVTKIKTAAEMRTDTPSSKLNEAILGVYNSIQKASDEGKFECLFDPRPTEYFNAVKDFYAKKGYTFRPYGYSGGVRQDCELICW